MYLLENNQVQQFVKFMISSTSCTYVCNLSRPAPSLLRRNFEQNRNLKNVNKTHFVFNA